MLVKMNKAIFLDRDGTINVEKEYLFRIEDFEFLPGVINSLKMIKDNGYLIIIITNQSGIARGYYTEDDFRKLNDWMLDELKTQGIIVDAVYYCPHHPNAKVEQYRAYCNCRKPGLGLFDKAINDFDIDLSKSYAIGDKIRDCSICDSSPCRGFLIANNEDPEIIESVRRGQYKNIKYAIDLASAVRKILDTYSR